MLEATKTKVHVGEIQMGPEVASVFNSSPCPQPGFDQTTGWLD